MRKFIWLSFDLSLNGDYERLFRWLDERSAKECGDGLACFYFDFRTENEKEELTSSMKSNIEIKEGKDRLYAVWERTDGRTRGSFLVGARKRAPWEGAFGRFSDDLDG